MEGDSTESSGSVSGKIGNVSHMDSIALHNNEILK
jgi:hypothetical protein